MDEAAALRRDRFPTRHTPAWHKRQPSAPPTPTRHNRQLPAARPGTLPSQLHARTHMAGDQRGAQSSM